MGERVIGRWVGWSVGRVVQVFHSVLSLCFKELAKLAQNDLVMWFVSPSVDLFAGMACRG